MVKTGILTILSEYLSKARSREFTNVSQPLDQFDQNSEFETFFHEDTDPTPFYVGPPNLQTGNPLRKLTLYWGKHM